MNDILYTRLLLWKKRSLSILFWLLLPIIATYLIVTISNTVRDDSNVPIGLVVEEQTEYARKLVDEITASSFLKVDILSEEEALFKLERHELDSVFVIQDGYEDALIKGKRNKLLSSYRTDLSFAYSPVKERIVSLVQEETGRFKAAYFIQNMEETYNGESNWSTEEINAKSMAIQVEENLLNTAYMLSNSDNQVTEPTIMSWNPWSLWAIFSFISTLFLSDWIIREKNKTVSIRYSFIKMSRISYYVRISSLYLFLFFLFDLLAMALFSIFLQQRLSLYFVFVLLSYRLMMYLLSFSFAQCFQSRNTFYAISIIVTLLLAIISGTIFPIPGITPKSELLEIVNPLHAFLHAQVSILWCLIGFLWFILILLRKERSHA